MKNIKDYLHLYLECEVLSSNSGMVWQLIGIVNDDGVLYHKDFKKNTASLQNLKPILRPLSDMTEEEAKEIGFWSELYNKITGTEKGHAIYDLYTAEKLRLALSKHFDLFGLIEAGLAINKTLNQLNDNTNG